MVGPNEGKLKNAHMSIESFPNEDLSEHLNNTEYAAYNGNISKSSLRKQISGDEYS